MDIRFTKRELDIMVTIETRNGNVAMIVDEVLGVQQVVLRQIEGLQCETDLIAGGALMGDGSVALIINTECLSSK